MIIALSAELQRHQECDMLSKLFACPNNSAADLVLHCLSKSLPFSGESDFTSWRFVRNNGEWWYWTPGDYWMYYRDNQWYRFDTNAYQPNNYRTGYRGIPDNGSSGIYYDDNRQQYRRDYSPDRRALRNPGNDAAGTRLGNAIGNTIRGAIDGEPNARANTETGGAAPD